ncbi:MAG: response regulator [Dehalogenimonas sp.]
MNQSAKKTILVVDDDPPIRSVVTHLLNSKYIIIEASDGIQAFQKAYTYHPDLILLDIMMPNMDGYNTLGKLKSDKSTKDIPVIMMTGLGFELNEKLSKQLGADDYITKPFESQVLIDTINRLVK